MKLLKALIVEDSEDDVLMLLRHLKRGGYEVEYQRVETPQSMKEALRSTEWQMVLSDFSMPQFDGLKALKILKETEIDIPFIMISGTIGEDTAVQAMLAGVDDYFVKGNLKRLIPAIERELKEAENRRARRMAEESLEEHKKRLHIALNAAGMGVWEWNMQTGEVYLSRECYEIFGTDNFDRKFEEFIKLVHPEDTFRVVKSINLAVKKHGNFKTEFRAVKENGDLIWLENYGLAEYDAEGKPLKFIGTVQDITRRKEGEEALRESEERLRMALEGANAGVWLVNFDPPNAYWSNEYRDIYGFSDEDVPSSHAWESRVHPDDLRRNLKTLRKYVEFDHDEWAEEYRIIHPTRGLRWIEDRVRIRRDVNKRVIGLSGINLDITDRKQSEEALQFSEENMRALIQASTQYVWSAGKDGESPEMYRWFTKKSGREIKSVDDLLQIIHPQDREKVKAAWYQALENKTVFNMTIRFASQTGEYFYMASRAVPMYNPDGSYRQWVGTCNDITERIKAEEHLMKSEKRFRSLINATSQIVWTANADGEITSAVSQSKTGPDLSGGTLTERWVVRLHPDDKYKVVKGFLSCIKEKREYLDEFRVMHDDGTYHYYVSRGTPVYEEDGSISEWVGTLTDVTSSKISEENLRKSEEQLRQAQKLESVGRLAGGIAHDFNNMLTAINGYSDLALRRLKQDDPLRRNIEEIKKAGERSAALTQQLLAFSRSTILQMQILDVNQIVNESIHMYQRLIGEHIQIVSLLNPQIDKIKADAGQLTQMLLNLVVNSRDAMPDGGTITIKTDNVFIDDNFSAQNACAQKGNYVMLSVTDTGTGIDEETRQSIFEPFFTTKEIGKGTGLGLSTVYGIVNQLGGCIVVKSKVGSGTTFEIYLPAEAENKSDVKSKRANGEVRGGSETILLVEDEELVRNLSCSVLDTCGYKVIEAKDGFEALEVCLKAKQKIDLLLTDVVMPRMSGRELAEKVKKLYPSIKILFTSGYTDDAVVRHGITEKEMNFIQKPYSFDDLTKKVRSVLDTKKS